MRQKADTNKRPCKTGPIHIILNAINIHNVYLLANMENCGGHEVHRHLAGLCS